MTLPTPTGSAPDDGSSAARIPTEQTVKPAGLIERLEAAEVGSRELDMAVAVSLGQPFKPERFLPTGRYRENLRIAAEADPYTTSLDAALSLAERVGLSCGDLLHAAWRRVSLRYRLHAEFWKPEHGSYPAAVALALCAAILKAVDDEAAARISARQEGGEG